LLGWLPANRGASLRDQARRMAVVELQPRAPRPPPQETVVLRAAIRADLEAARAVFQRVLDAVPDADLSRPSANPAWTNGELLYHMTMDMDFIPAEVRVVRQGWWFPKPPAWLFNRLNILYTRRQARRMTRPLLARKYEANHAALLAALDTVQDDEWRRTTVYPAVDPPFLRGRVSIARIFRYHAHHVREHAAQIR
jgi:hypothetical protein